MAQNQAPKQNIKRRQRRTAILCVAGGIGLILASLLICFIYFGTMKEDVQDVKPAITALPYDAESAFSLSDLTTAQINQIRQAGRIEISDGPRGISIGDSLDRITERYPTTYAGEQPDDFEILYCAKTLQGQNGSVLAVPPRGILTADNSTIIVTLMAPTSAYPAGAEAYFASYEHVYCKYTIDPNTMTVSSITLGIE